MENNILTFKAVVKGDEEFGSTILQSDEGILGRRFGIYIDYRNTDLAFIGHHYDPDFEAKHLGRKRSVSQCETLCRAYYKKFEKMLLPYLSQEDISKLFKIKQPSPSFYVVDASLSLEKEMERFIGKLIELKKQNGNKPLKPKFSRFRNLTKDYMWLIVDEMSCNWIFDIMFKTKNELDELIEQEKNKKGGELIYNKYKKEVIVVHKNSKGK